MHTQKEKITKKERRLLRKQGVIVDSPINSLNPIVPLTQNQKKAFDAYKKGKNLLLHGSAGTGKTFIALYLALNDVINNNKYKKVIIIRSTVPSRDMGFLPGTHKEKAKVYETPYHTICSELFGQASAYTSLKQKNQIEFISTSFIRGTTINDAVIIVDEMQNLNWMELSTSLTRVGDNCKVILSGDTRQSDLSERDGKHDLLKIMNVCKRMNIFHFVQMTTADIVRSGFVKDFIITCEELGY